MSAIILFDGVCNFCNSSINFIIAQDKTGIFKFAPLQSEAGKELTAKHGLRFAGEGAPEGSGIPIDSVVLIEDDKAYTHSTAALRIARLLGGIWSLAYAFIIVPRPVRDIFYNLFARYRYKLFGKKDVCMMPTPELRQKFLS